MINAVLWGSHILRQCALKCITISSTMYAVLFTYDIGTWGFQSPCLYVLGYSGKLRKGFFFVFICLKRIGIVCL